MAGVQQHDLVDGNHRPLLMEPGLQQALPGEGLQRPVKLLQGVWAAMMSMSLIVNFNHYQHPPAHRRDQIDSRRVLSIRCTASSLCCWSWVLGSCGWKDRRRCVDRVRNAWGILPRFIRRVSCRSQCILVRIMGWFRWCLECTWYRSVKNAGCIT